MRDVIPGSLEVMYLVGVTVIITRQTHHRREDRCGDQTYPEQVSENSGPIHSENLLGRAGNFNNTNE